MTTINEITDLVQILQERPEWLQVIRGLVIGEELAQVPQHLVALDQRLSEYIEFTKQNTETVNRRLDALEQRLDDFIEFVKQNSETVNRRLDALEQRLDDFIEFVKQNSETVNRRMDALEAGQERLEATTTAILRDMGTLKGAHARNSALQATRRIARVENCRQIRLLNDDELYDLLQANDAADITPGEQRSFEDADIIIQAENRDTGDTCYIAVEASFTAHENDIRRATRNADYLARFTGKAAIPVVAAVLIDPKVQDDFDSGKVQWYALQQRDVEPD